MEQDERLVVLLGDISVHAFKEAFDRFPKRIYNVGTCEQAMIGLAAGLALDGMIPVVHTIAPFLVERAFEQLKLDFGYQQLGGNFVSVGGSYEYSKLGCTHHSPGDISILKTIPGMEIYTPGHPDEFDHFFKANYATDRPKYWRLARRSNLQPYVDGLVKTGFHGDVLAIGPMLDRTLEACKDLDVTLFYYAMAEPFWGKGMKNVVVVEPGYEGSFAHEFQGLSIGVPRRFLTTYGTVEQHDVACGLDAYHIRQRIRDYFNI